ncbi:transcription factor [Klebsiella aerogenes]
MTKEQAIFDAMRQAINAAPQGNRSSEMHLQLLKYAQELKNVPRESICEEVGLSPSFKTEVGKMRNIIDRLVAAGLDVSRI